MANKIVGTPGDDVLKGTNGKDIIKGKGGNDVIKGKGGNDVLKGGKGDDKLKGGKGDDQLKAGKGDDLVIGGKGADDHWGGGGADIFKFKPGHGFHDLFPAAPTSPDSFDDVIHDFSGFLDPNGVTPVSGGQGDLLDIPTDMLTGASFELTPPGDFWIIYRDGLGTALGSFYIANTKWLVEADFI